MKFNFRMFNRETREITHLDLSKFRSKDVELLMVTSLVLDGRQIIEGDVLADDEGVVEIKWDGNECNIYGYNFLDNETYSWDDFESIVYCHNVRYLGNTRVDDVDKMAEQWNFYYYKG